MAPHAYLRARRRQADVAQETTLELVCSCMVAHFYVAGISRCGKFKEKRTEARPFNVVSCYETHHKLHLDGGLEPVRTQLCGVVKTTTRSTRRHRKRRARLSKSRLSRSNCCATSGSSANDGISGSLILGPHHFQLRKNWLPTVGTKDHKRLSATPLSPGIFAGTLARLA